MSVLLLLPVLILLVGAVLLARLSRHEHPKVGLVAGHLRPDGPAANFVCSETGTVPARAVAPYSFTGSPEAAWVRLRSLIIDSGGEVKQESADYLWATFQTPVFRFVDDVEVRLDRAAGVIQIRSASRVGRSDLGVNCRRVEALRSRFAGGR